MDRTALYTYIAVGAGPSDMMMGFKTSFLRFLFTIVDVGLIIGCVGPRPFPLAPAIMGGSADD